MTKNQTIFSCSNCSAQYPKWQGRCLECGKWGTIEEEIKPISNQEQKNLMPPATSIKLSDIPIEKINRYISQISELDRVLGGGLVPGSLILLGGDPGIGKSTLALQWADKLESCLYVSGEESGVQVKLRAERLKIQSREFKFLNETNIETIIATAKQDRPKLLIIDSIQTVYSQSATGSPGSVSQITASTSQLLNLCKNENIATLIIGHVTKDGNVAGPKTLEHLVDAVIYLESDDQNMFRILRSIKNRFGSTGEIGIFEMSGDGFSEIKDPAGIFAQQINNLNPGSCATMIIEGSRPFLIESQALCIKTVFGYPIRKSSGFDANRLQMLLAVASKYLKNDLSSYDVYFNIVGGLKIKDTTADLPAVLAIISAYLNKPLPADFLALGEIGLAGEIRNVSQIERRIKEAKRLGFKKIALPANPKNKELKTSELIELKHISEIISLFK